MLHRLLKAWAAPEDENTQDLIPPTASPPRRRKLAAAAAAAPAEGEAAVAPAVPLKARRRAAPGDNSRLDMYRDKPWYATDKDARGQWTFRTDAELHWDGDRLKSRWAGRQAFGSARALQRDVQPWVFPDDIPSADDPLLELPAGVGAWFPDQVAAAVMVNVASRIIYVKMGMGKTLMAALAARLHLRRERRGGVPGRVWLVGPKFTLKGTQAEFAKVLTADASSFAPPLPSPPSFTGWCWTCPATATSRWRRTRGSICQTPCCWWTRRTRSPTRSRRLPNAATRTQSG